MQPLLQRWTTDRGDGTGVVQGVTDRTLRPLAGAPASPAPARRGQGVGALGLVLLGALALWACAPQLVSGLAPAASGVLSRAGQADQACAAQQGTAAAPGACVRGTQLVAQAAVAPGGADAGQPGREGRSDNLKLASDVVKLLSETGGVANAITQWRTAFGRTP